MKWQILCTYRHAPHVDGQSQRQQRYNADSLRGAELIRTREAAKPDCAMIEVLIVLETWHRTATK